MNYLLKSDLLTTPAKTAFIRPKTEEALFDSVAHHLQLNAKLLTFNSSLAGVWAIFDDNRGFVGRVIELQPREDMAGFRKHARTCATLIKDWGL